MKKRLVIAFALLLLLSTYNPQKLISIKIFDIKEIDVENTLILKDHDIKKNLTYLYNKNLIFLDKLEIEKKLQKIDFIESFKIKKIYPNKLKIKIFEKKPMVILQFKKEKFYISENFELIKFINLENYKDLPLVFGNKEDFKKLYKNLEKINFPSDSIIRYYLFESKRWDLKTYKKKTIKLPSTNYIESLKNYMDVRKKSNYDRYTVFDYRINNQLILK